MVVLPTAAELAPTKPKLVKSLLKGLGCLSLVNKHNGVSVADAAAQLRIPKSTAYRVLETLCRGGYAVREMDGRYRATSLVRTLSAGFDEEEWVLKIAHPELVGLGRQVVWGVGLATQAGMQMHIRETTDRDSPLTIERWTAGTRLPLDGSGPGQLFLAWLPDAERNKCIEALLHEPLRADSPLHSPDMFKAHLERVRKRGFVICQVSDKEAAVSVPIFLRGRFVASLGMHFIWRVLTDQHIESEFVPLLHATAKRIEDRLGEGNYELGKF